MDASFDGEIRLFLRELAVAAAQETLPAFRSSLTIENKAPSGCFDPVTEADRSAEKRIRSVIEARYPTHGIEGEEYGLTEGSSEWSWIIDPIDGTRSFISGMPTWGTLIGLLHKGVPCYGMMSQPMVGDCFVGGGELSQLIRPEGVTSLKCRATRLISDATLFSTTPDMFKSGAELEAFNRVSSLAKLTRFGADCYGYCLMASGFADLVIEADLQFYDIAPVIPIVEAAGGVVSDWEGRPVISGGRVVAACNRALQKDVLDILNTGS
ncbi:MAG: histidinol-phosphatase [Gammaproteobacteria bacterium]|jgi:myo-inositol-1(or 4)-monophosphatase